MKEMRLKELTHELQEKYGRKLTVDERSLLWDVICLEDEGLKVIHEDVTEKKM